jgi:hypothetical protein
MNLNERIAQLKKVLRPGDYILHTGCGGLMQEHKFTGWDGNWICGKATRNTMTLIPLMIGNFANDISPMNITHINRTSVEDFGMKDTAKQIELLKRLLKPGDYIMHTGDGGLVQEHKFTKWDCNRICGTATLNTINIMPYIPRWTNDIHPNHITHINRTPIEDCDALEAVEQAEV